MTRISAARAVVEILKAEGVDTVFGLPGGHVIGIFDALYDTPEIRLIRGRHEHSVAHMATAYAQLTRRPGLCLVTAGPGATNLLTGIAEAFVGAVPVVVLAGRGDQDMAHRGDSQEVATDRIFAPVTKWSLRVNRAELLPALLREAFTVAQSGRPGPVYLDLSADMLRQDIDFGGYVPAGAPTRPAGDPERVADAVLQLTAAGRPLIVAGGGAVASGAFDELRALAERLSAPVLTSLAGRTALPNDHILAAGGLGVHATPLSRRLLTEADVVLSLGCRFESMETNWREGFMPAPTASVLQVDIEPAEIARSLKQATGIVGDVRLVLQGLLAAIPPNPGWAAHKRVSELRREVAELDDLADRLAASNEAPIHPMRVLRAARQVFPRESIIGIDIGCLAQHMGGAFPYFRVFDPNSTIVPSSFYGMGDAAAGLPVARLVHPDRPAVGFVGDGSFQMMLDVLPVAAEYRLGVTWCILDDGALGSIRDIQHEAFDGRFIGTEFAFQPDFARLAEACGCYGERIERPGDVTAALERALEANASGRPAVLDFVVSRRRTPSTASFFGMRKTEF